MSDTKLHIAGTASSEDSVLLGREALLTRVLGHLRTPGCTSIALYGPPGIGKSSFLRFLEFELADQDYDQLYFDLRGKAELSLGELAYQVAQALSSALAVKCPERSRFDEEGRFFAEEYLPAIDARSGGSRCVLLFDEFDNPEATSSTLAGSSFLPYMLSHTGNLENISVVFCLGNHRPHLSYITRFSVAEPIPRLSQADADVLIRGIEKAENVTWQSGAVQRVWGWTRGHPSLTQLLCKAVNESIRATFNGVPHEVEPRDVDIAVEPAIWHADEMFSTLWQGLRPNEKTLVSSMSSLKNGKLPRSALDEVLKKHQMPIGPGDVEAALTRLVATDIVSGDTTHIDLSIPMFKKWVLGKFPPEKIQKEIAQASTLAEKHFQEGKRLCELEQHAQAEVELRQTLHHSPGHRNARLILAHLLLADSRFDEAIALLNQVPHGESPAIRDALVEAYLGSSTGKDPAAQLKILEQVLRIDPEHTQAKEQYRQIWMDRGEALLAQGAFESAIEAFTNAEAPARVEDVRRRMQSGDVRQKLEHAGQLEAEGKWSEAIDIYESLTSVDPGEAQWQAKLRQLRTQAKLEERYQQAVQALETGDRDTAQRLLAEIILRDPGFRDVPELLLRATAGTDIRQLQRELQETRAALEQATEQLRQSQSQPAAAAPAPAEGEEVEALRERVRELQIAAHNAEKQERAGRQTLYDAQEQIKVLRKQLHESVARQEAARQQEQVSQERLAEMQMKLRALSDQERQKRAADMPAPQETIEPATAEPAVVTGPLEPGQQPEAALQQEEAPPPVHRPRPRSHSSREYRRSGRGGRAYRSRRGRRPDSQSQRDFRRRMSWIGGTLLWLPLFLWTLWPWVSNPFEWGYGGKFFVAVSAFIAWLVSASNGQNSREENTSFFLYASLIMAFMLGAIMTGQSLSMSLPDFISQKPGTTILALFTYALIVSVPVTYAGTELFATFVGMTGGVSAGIVLFVTGGGAIESTLVIALLAATLLRIKQTELGSSTSAGILAAIPTGFGIFAMTTRLFATDLATGALSCLVSFSVGLAASAIVFGIVVFMKKVLEQD